LGRRSLERREKDLTFVIDTAGVEDSFICVTLERLGVDVKLSADFGRRMPAGLAFMLGQAVNSISQTDSSHTQTGKALTCPRA
jgi:hypothetical protein